MCRIAAAAPCSNGLKRSSTASETESDTSAADYLPSFAFVRLVRRGQVLFFYVGGLLCLFFLKNCERSRTWYRSVFVRPSVVWLTLLLSLVARCSPTLAFASGTKDLTSSDVNLCMRHFRRCQVVKAIQAAAGYLCAFSVSLFFVSHYRKATKRQHEDQNQALALWAGPQNTLSQAIDR